MVVTQTSRHLPLVTVTRLAETLFKIVRQESVEHGIDCRVRVLQAVREQNDDNKSVALVKPWILSETGNNK